jgi:hypothetical protein
MPTFIKTGFWEKTRKGYKEWLNLDQLIQTLVPPPTPPTYKVYTARVLMSDGSANVFENTLGATITWIPSSGQISSGAIVPLIGQNNVYVQVTSGANTSDPKIVSGNFQPSPWFVFIKQTDNAGVADSTQSVYVEIRVYT